MVTTVHQHLTPNVYTFIFDTSRQEEEDQNQAPNAEKKARKAKKDGKQIGLVVRAIEEWEINLIKLTRNCKLTALVPLYCLHNCYYCSVYYTVPFFIYYTVLDCLTVLGTQQGGQQISTEVHRP